MEDMARLALVEESVRDIDKFRKILHELLRYINVILENPHDYQLRTIKSNLLKEVAKFESVTDYLKYVGFELGEDNLVYPTKSTLSNLRMAQVAIERKINFCFGCIDKSQVLVKNDQKVASHHNLTRVNVLTTSNPFLLKIQELFNNMLIYEDPELQALAREQIPIVTLQLMALDRVRDQQMQIKTGKIQGTDLPFDIALLMELLYWFKNKFFKWVDKPPCEVCGGETIFTGTSSMTTASETCRVELYKCSVCPGRSRFPRHNDPRTLLRTRRGRCGEWANCFTLMCRALGYDTRYVYDTTDHVWCEVFDYDSKTWLHADPCEAKLDAPLMYCHGWGKKLSYVIALSRDDLQDVTWRYTMNHGEVLSRRTVCSEDQLISTLLTLRQARQESLSQARKDYLARRTVLELVLLMQERKPSDYETSGRISGSRSWRTQRGESGKTPAHTFTLTQPAVYSIRYHSASDQYRISRDDEEIEALKSWSAGVYACCNVFRKVETDWKMAYLAREEGEDTGSISWRLQSHSGFKCTNLSISVHVALYENGCVEWSISFDGQTPQAVRIGETPTHFPRTFHNATITAKLTGGVRDVAWQHAQLFRQSLDTDHQCFDITVHVEKL